MLPRFTKYTKVIAIIFVCGLFLFSHALNAFAYTSTTTPASKDSISFTPEITIPGLLNGSPITITGSSIGEYIRVIFIFFIWSVGILATVMVIYGGIRWVAAAGNATKINDARGIINDAVIGVIIALTSVVLLNIINPNLTSFKGIILTPFDKIVVDFGNDLIKSAGEIPVCAKPKVSGSPTQVCSGNHPPENPVDWKYQCSNTLNDWINHYAKQYFVDASLIKTIILIETPPTPRGNDFVYSGPELANGPGYGLGQFKVPMTKDILAIVNGGYPKQCTLDDLNNATGQRLPPTCREWMDGKVAPNVLFKAGLNVQVGMVAEYLHIMLSDKKCINGSLALAAAGFNRGKAGIGATFCNPNYLSSATPAKLAEIKAKAVQYIDRVKSKYPEVCASATD